MLAIKFYAQWNLGARSGSGSGAEWESESE